MELENSTYPSDFERGDALGSWQVCFDANGALKLTRSTELKISRRIRRRLSCVMHLKTDM